MPYLTYCLIFLHGMYILEAFERKSKTNKNGSRK